MTPSDTASPIFQISIVPSGRSFSAHADETILSAGLRHGVGLPYGCKDGACGSCKAKLLTGRVSHGAYQSQALSADEARAGFVLPCCAVAQSDVRLESRQVTSAGAFAIKKMPARVSQLSRLCPDVMLLTLQLPANDTFAYHAGQYVELILPGGVRRSYSMASAPHRCSAAGGVLEFHIRHMPGGRFTERVFDGLKEKEILRFEGPFGSFYLREDSDKPIVMLASGTGFAPLKALLEHMQFKNIQRPVSFYWGARRPLDLYMHAWMQQKANEMPNLRYLPVVSDALAEDAWTGRSGLVHLAVLEDFPDLSGYEVYACGVPVMVSAAQSAYTGQAQLPPEAFFADAFTSEADKAQAAQATPAAGST